MTADRLTFSLPRDDPEEAAARVLALVAYPEAGAKGEQWRRGCAFYLRAWHHQQRKAADSQWRLSIQSVVPAFLLAPRGNMIRQVNLALDRLEKRFDAAWILQQRVFELAQAVSLNKAPADRLRPILREVAGIRARKKFGPYRNDLGDISDRIDKLNKSTWEASLPVLHLARSLVALLNERHGNEAWSVLQLLDGEWVCALIADSERRFHELSVSLPRLETAISADGVRDLRRLRDVSFVKLAIV